MLSPNLKSALSWELSSFGTVTKERLDNAQSAEATEKKPVETSVNIQLNIDLIAKQPTLNRTASAVTHFQGKFTSIQIREPAATEAVIESIL